MTDSPAAILAALLTAASLVGGSSGWLVSTGFEPDQDGGTAQCVTLYDTAGVKDAHPLSGAAPVFHYGVQVRVRSQDRGAGWAKAEAIATALYPVRGRTPTDQVTISTTTYTLLGVVQTTSTRLQGFDGPKRRAIHMTNYLVAVR
jgi:hypothetical protein